MFTLIISEEDMGFDESTDILNFLLDLGVDRFSVKFLDLDNQLRQNKPDKFFRSLQKYYLDKEYLKQSTVYLEKQLDTKEQPPKDFSVSVGKEQFVESWSFSEETLKLIVNSFDESIIEYPCIAKLGLGDWNFYKNKVLKMSVCSHDDELVLYNLTQAEFDLFTRLNIKFKLDDNLSETP